MRALNEAFPEGLYSVASAKVHHLLVRERKWKEQIASQNYENSLVLQTLKGLWGCPGAPTPYFENCWSSVQNHELFVSVLILPLPLFHLFYLRPRGTLRGRGRNWGTGMSNRRLSHHSPSVTSTLWVCGMGYFSFKWNQESQSLRRNQTHRMGKLTHSNRNTTEFLVSPSQKEEEPPPLRPHSGSPHRGCQRKVLRSWGNSDRSQPLLVP